MIKDKAFRFGMWLIVLLGIISSGFVLNFTNPYQNIGSLQKNIISIIAFYFSIGLFFTGFFSLFLYWIRRRSISEEDVQHIHVGVSFRQGVLLAFGVMTILILQSFRILVWWDALLAIGAIMMIELYFLAR